MKHFRFSLLIFLTIFSFKGLSQSDFKPGYYISLKNDTIHGLIDYRGDLRNAKYCVYKKDENSNSVKYEPNDIKAYRYIDGKFYISRLIKTENEKKRIFVEYLVNGIADLFYYRDLQGDHYFIETEEGKLLELTNEEKTVYKEGMKVGNRKTNRHIGLLKATFADCMEVQSQINKVELNHKSLINITKTYHDYVCDEEKCVIYEKKLPLVRVKVAPSLGFGISTYKLENSILEFDKSIYPSIGIALNTTMPRLNEKISFQIDAQFSKNYFYSFYQEGNHYIDIHIHTFFSQTSAGFKYTYPKGRLRPTLAIGGTLLSCLNTSARATEEVVSSSVVTTSEYDELPFPSTLFGGFAQLGCDYIFSDKLTGFANLKYYYNKGLTSDPYEYKVFIQSVNINVGLYF